MIAPFTVVSDSAQVHYSAKVWHFTVIGEGVHIGPDTVIGSHCYIGKDTTIGRGVHIQTGVFIPNGTTIEDYVFIGPNVTFTDDRYPRAGNKAYFPEPPKVRQSASIGAGATILPGVEIGASAMIGAGAVVARDVAIGDTVRGDPARERKGTASFGHVDAFLKNYPKARP